MPGLIGRCTRRSTQIHHTKRRGPFLNDVTTWMGCCNECHRFVETHANLARVAGVIIDERRPLIKPFTEDDYTG
jgi:hypothetical protein